MTTISKISLAAKSLMLCVLLCGVAAAQTGPSLTPTTPSLDPTLKPHPTPVPRDQSEVADPRPQVQPVIPGQGIYTQEYAPVCGRTGHASQTYSNRCVAEAAGAQVVSGGAC